MHTHRRQALVTRRGFTLIELIAAIVVLSIAVPPALFGMRQATIHRVDPIRFSRARFLAIEQLEQIISDRHSTTRGFDWLTAAHYPAQDPVPTDPAFSRTVRFDHTGPDLKTPGSGYLTATVRIAWNDSAGKPRALEIATVLTEFEN